MKLSIDQINAMFEEKSGAELSDSTIKRSTGVTAAAQQDTVRANIRESQRRARSRPEVRANMSRSKSLQYNTPDMKDKLSKMATATWQSETIRKKRQEAIIAAVNKPEVKARRSANQSRGQMKPCTIDGGVTVYSSLSEMAKALGWGKHGARSPNLQYLAKK